MIDQRHVKSFLAGIAMNLLLSSSVVSIAGQADLKDRIERAKQYYTHIVLAEINQGRLIHAGDDVECGILYRATVERSIQGRSVQVELSFISKEYLTIGARYIIFLERGSPYELPADAAPTEDQYKKEVRGCMDDLTSHAPDFWTGFNPVVLEVVSPSFDQQEQWINVDVLRFAIPESVTSRAEDVEHCTAHPETLEPTECSLVSRRTLVPLVEFFDEQSEDADEID